MRLLWRLLTWLNERLYLVETDPARNAEYDRIDRDLRSRGL
jgi:hypothetical protein